MTPAALLAQGTAVEDLGGTIGVSHGGDFFRDRIDVDGTLTNRSARDFPCVLLMFEVADRGKRTVHAIRVTDVAARAFTAFSGVLPPGETVRHVATLSCVAADEAQPATCTISGQLKSRSGFQITSRGRSRGVVRIGLYDRGKVLQAVRIRIGGDRATYRFTKVPVGRDYLVAIGEGWLLNGGGFMPARCGRGERSLTLPGAMVTYDFDFDRR